MAEIGIVNELTVVKEVDFGVYLDGGGLAEILLPQRYVPRNCKAGDILRFLSTLIPSVSDIKERAENKRVH